MAKVFVSFEAESPDELIKLMLHFALKGKTPPSWVSQPPPPLDPQSVADDKSEMSDEEYDSKHPGNGEDPSPEPTPAPEPAPKRTRAARAPRVSAAPGLARAADEMQAVARGEAEPARTHAPVAPVNLPPLDTLKAIVTNAVRLAQKGEGSKTILDLLPQFKDTTGLTFVMNAEDKHRAALYDLVQAAGLPVV
jgi:hypothetical protein